MLQAEDTPRAKLGIAPKLVIMACAAVFASSLTVGVFLHRNYIESLNEIEMTRLISKAEDATSRLNLTLSTARNAGVSLSRLPPVDAYLNALSSPDGSFDGFSSEIWRQRAAHRVSSELMANPLISAVTYVRLSDSREILKLARRGRAVQHLPLSEHPIRSKIPPISVQRPAPGEPPPLVPLALRFPQDPSSGEAPVIEGLIPIAGRDRVIEAVLIFEMEPKRFSRHGSVHDLMYLVHSETGQTILAGAKTDDAPNEFYREFPSLEKLLAQSALPSSGFYKNRLGETNAMSFGQVPLSPRDRSSLYIVFAENIEQLVNATAIAPAKAILAGGGILVVSLVLVWLFAINLTGPLREIAKAARLYGETNAAVPLPVQAESEVGDVARALSSMQNQVEQRAAALRQEIEAHKRTERELAVAIAEARNASNAKSSFLATMSHEIRTPMNGVIGMADLLSQTKLDNEQRELLATICASGENLLAIINDILDFSKIESGKMDLESQELSPALCIEEVVELLSPRIEEKSLEAIISIDPQAPRVILGDVTRIRQILTNLVGNAIKFTQQGEIEVRLDLQEQAGQEATLAVSVRDTGIGIPVDKRAHLFGAFSQLDSSTTRQYGGTGLGLAICSRLVRLMGGEITIGGEEGRGSIFRFTLKAPIVELAPDQSELKAIAALNGRRALIIDPNPAHAQAVIRTLESWGTRCKTALSYQEANAAINKGFEPQLVVANQIRIPDIGTLFHRCNSGSAEPQIPFICFISRENAKRVMNNRASSALRFLPKPFTRRRLIQAASNLGESLPPPSPAILNETAAISQDLPLKILVADDNPTNQLCAVEFLQRLGYSPDLANNGLEAVALSEKNHYDLIFMDMRMPEMDGPDAVRAIRRFPADRPRPRIVAFTANAMAEDREACLASGMDDFISKPARLEAFRKVILDCAIPAKS